ncbi:MAG: TlpA family protein disulfide reductase [Muribaculaceae bacterium]|nr:TlpA family protein disulfide reductase [Muribaculaceae bacterium]
MKKLFLHIALIFCAVIACVSCGDKPRTVEYPLISAGNTTTLDVVSVDLNDSTTVLGVNAYYRPGYWIRIASDSRLEADGKSYALISADGIELDKEVYMPESGKMDFALTFEPLPLSTKKFDFIEGDDEGAFKLWDIDLTRNTPPAYPDGLPAALKKEPAGVTLTDPVFEIGETTLNIHLLNNRPDYSKNWTIYANNMSGEQQQIPFKVDDEGNAVVRFDQYGTTQLIILNEGGLAHFLSFWVDPCETVNVYLDMNRTGAMVMRNREEDMQSSHDWIYTDGKYSDLSRLYGASNLRKYQFNLYDGEFADYHMTGDEYFDMMTSKYQACSDSIANADAPDAAKEMAQLTLKNNFLQAIAEYRYLLGLNYRMQNNAWRERVPEDSITAVLTDEHFKKAVGIVDPSDKKLMYNDCAIGLMDWTPYGASNDLSKSVGMYGMMADKAQALTLTQADLDTLRTLSDPFFAAACDSIFQRSTRLAEKLKEQTIVQPTPDVPADKVFDAIVAPHLGKVVVVDLWNTWCGPCKAALKANEPLKEGELADDDIVWIYIADESSALPTYLSMIPDIKGLHYRLNAEQKKAISSRFGVDGIPYYIIVDRKGNAVGRPDLRDHNLYIKTIKEKLAE